MALDKYKNIKEIDKAKSQVKGTYLKEKDRELVSKFSDR